MERAKLSYRSIRFLRCYHLEKSGGRSSPPSVELYLRLKGAVWSPQKGGQTKPNQVLLGSSQVPPAWVNGVSAGEGRRLPLRYPAFGGST
jgi:hypothetical protein